MAERDQHLTELTQHHHLLHAVEHMGWAAKALSAGIAPVRPDLLWEAIDVLTKALEKAVYPRPARRRGRPSKEEMPTPDDLVARPYADPMLAAEIEEDQKRMAALPRFIPDVPLMPALPVCKAKK